MTFCRSFVLLTPLACLLAQTPPTTSKPKPAATAPGPVVAAPGASSAASAAAPISADKVVLTIGDEKVTAGELAKLVATLPEQYRANAAGPGRKEFVDTLIRMKLLAQEGRRRKLDQEPGYLVQLALQRDNLLAGTVYSAISQGVKISNEEVQQYYDQHKVDFESASASHILIRFKGSQVPLRAGQKELTEEEALAKAVILAKEIKAGGDFAAIAKRESDDPSAATQGGNLGSFRHGQMVPAFEEAAFKLAVGTVSEPVKTPFGYHLIKLAQHDVKSVAEARPEIEAKLRPQAAMKAVDTLRQSTNVVIDAAYLAEGKAPAEGKK
jgi:peptidyl-prolyl cis-trans isomerase C